MLGYIEEGEPINLPLPNRRASQFVQSHFYLDDLPQSTEPLDENPRPHSELGARIEDDFVSADEGYQGRPFPQMRRPSFLGPGPETDSESGPDEAFHRDGFDAPRPPPAAPSSVSGRLGEAALRGGEAIIAAGATGVGQAVERFGFRDAGRVLWGLTWARGALGLPCLSRVRCFRGLCGVRGGFKGRISASQRAKEESQASLKP